MIQVCPPLPPAIAVTGPAAARLAADCAAELDVPALLLCPQEAAAFGGPAWFRELVDAAARHSGARLLAGLDAGGDGGIALEALQLDLDVVIFSGPDNAAERLGRLARSRSRHLLTAMPEVLRLAEGGNPTPACRTWLEQR